MLPLPAPPGQEPRLGFRHCDPRYPFLWTHAAQPAARWHGEDEGPANYFCDTPEGAWAEFLRHEEITDAADLAGVRRSLWAVALPAEGYVQPRSLAAAQLHGGLASHAACRAKARRLRAAGATRLEVPSAALLPGAAAGWRVNGAALERADAARDGKVWVLFGTAALTGWVAAEAAAPPAAVLPFVRALRD
ncbi:MAG: hypothetical protein JNL30_14510 [Rubrivivax sp.]|nr:hypothetical protein [Rubrivivax sp.]